MNTARWAFGAALGRRLPVYDGERTVEGLHGGLVIRRDRWAVPHIDASCEADAWFGLGFCQGQDRAFQLESLVRVVRGTLAALAGPDAVPVDRLARRIGFRRVAVRDIGVVDEDVVASMGAFAAGVNAGIGQGLKRLSHEFTLLRGRPTSWDAADVFGFSKLMAFLLASNWDSELARLAIVERDGLDALAAVGGLGTDWLPAAIPPGVPVGRVTDHLAEDLARFVELTPAGGASNNWAVAPARTSTGRPLLANDPHLAPTLPTHFYLAHLRCPDWEAAGASLVGSHGIFAGHNEVAAWGVTAGMVDNTDLAVEQLGPDGRSVLRGDRFVPCEVVRERIEVKGGEPVDEDVLCTPEGPVISPALDGVSVAVSLRATWLEARPLRGLLELVRLRTAADFHERLHDFPSASMHVAFATVDGHIGSQLVGEPPMRRSGWGALPISAHDERAGWDDTLPFADMPRQLDPECGWLATANGRPTSDREAPFISVDFADGYRMARIGELLAARDDWDVTDMAEVQLDVFSLPWQELREVVLSAPVATVDGALARMLLQQWDGQLAADSEAATIYQHLVAELLERIAYAKAPNSAEWVLGRGFTPLVPDTLFATNRIGQLVRLLRAQPEGWFRVGWPQMVGNALEAVADRLLAEGRGGAGRLAWGRVRPLWLRHPVGDRPPLDRVFNLGPLVGFGDADTPAQAAVGREVLGNPVFTAALRMVVDVGAWDRCRWALPGGQSGNPCSPHYDDQLNAWGSGEGVPIAWAEDDVSAATRHTLRLAPATAGSASDLAAV